MPESASSPTFPHPLDGIQILHDIDKQKSDAAIRSQTIRFNSSMTLPATEEQKANFTRRISKHYPKFCKLTGYLYNNLELTKLDSLYARLINLKERGLQERDIAKILPPADLIDTLDDPESKSKAMKYINFINMGRASFATKGLRKQGATNEEIITAIISTHKLLDKGFTYKDMNEIISHSAYSQKTRPLEVLNDVAAIDSLANLSKKFGTKNVVERFKQRGKYLTKVVKRLYSEEESSLSRKRKAKASNVKAPLEDLFPTSPTFHADDPYYEISQYEPVTKKVRFTDGITKNGSHTNGYLLNGSSNSREL